MSPDTVAAFFAKYGSMAKAVCQEVPEHIHPHMMRHTRAMHLYQSGMPMVLLSQYLGHAQVETTMIYAYADTEMKRAAIQKADAVRGAKPVPDEIWADNEEMILKLSGLLKSYCSIYADYVIPKFLLVTLCTTGFAAITSE